VGTAFVGYVWQIGLHMVLGVDLVVFTNVTFMKKQNRITLK
jgi:hypothetical protein